MPANTPLSALPYPLETDTPDVPRDVQALATALDGKVAKITTSALSAGPPASPAEGDHWVATGQTAFGVGIRWHFQYDATAAQWRFIGGPPLGGIDAGPLNNTGAANTWQGISAAPLAVVRNGAYLARFVARLATPGNVAYTFWHCFWTTNNIGAGIQETMDATVTSKSITNEYAFTLTAGQTLGIAGYSSSPGNTPLYSASLTMLPLYVT